MPIIRIDWEKIKGRFDGRTQLFALTDQQAALLLSLTEQLTWDATFKTADYEFDDRDYLAAEVADTQRNLMMGVDLADIITYIDDIEDLLEALQTLGVTDNGCCDNISPLGETYESVNDYPGTPPATWGSEPVDDLDHWQQLICGAASRYVEHLADMGEQIQIVVTAGAVVVGVIAGGLALLGAAGLILPIAYGTAVGITTGLIASVTLATFSDVSDDITAAADDIKCAIYANDVQELMDVIEAAISPLAWSLFFQFVPYASALATMIDGGNQSGDLPVVLDDTCADCEEEELTDESPDFFYTTVQGVSHSYDSENGWWTIDSESESGCDGAHVDYYSDAGKTTRLYVRVEFLTCHPTPDSCGGVDRRRGWEYDGGFQIVWTGTHGVDTAGAVHRWKENHNTPYTTTFRLYVP